MADSSDKGEEYGVLLYYKYTNIPDLQHLFTFYESNCNSLALLGRVRLAPHGVNVTVGGKLSSLEEHIATVKMNSLFKGTDFKLASCHQPSNDRVAKECGFTSLSIRIVKELVTFSSHPLLKSPEVSDAGRHLSAIEFHSVLQTAGKFLDENKEKRIVLLDARNVYETRIGKFDTPNVETLDPGIRQYSDLPLWIDNNSEQLCGSHVLMYCTGGIRCEMASAYVRSKGAGFENVFQLYGGIQRYLEQYPDGGFFKGKNFVFDHRVSVGSSDGNILGTCLVCSCSYDDYTSRSRCIHCRMLVLVCNICQEKNSVYVCELCKESDKSINSIQSSQNGNLKPSVSVSQCTSKLPQCPSRNGTAKTKKLRILCLHGFRQNASSFKGRTGSLIKKLKNIADLIFINAAHELPFMYQPNQTDQNHDHKSSPPPIDCNKKFAWLISPNSDTNPTDVWKVATCPFDPLQYRTQTGGFDESLAYLQTVSVQSGPFDGILGFSQGAAMTALLCAQKEKVKDGIDFRFAILCSGFVSSLLDCERGSIKCPSLHIFGNERGEDGQISNSASRDLANLFDDDCSVITEHDKGHIIPTRPPYIDQIKDFLQQFL